MPPPKRFLHIVRFKASSRWEYPLPSLRSSSNFLRLLPLLLVTYISPFIFPSITCFRRQFLRSMWPIQLAFRFLISCRIFLCSLTLSNTSPFLTWSVQLIFSILLQYVVVVIPFWRGGFGFVLWAVCGMKPCNTSGMIPSFVQAFHLVLKSKVIFLYSGRPDTRETQSWTWNMFESFLFMQ